MRKARSRRRSNNSPTNNNSDAAGSSPSSSQQAGGGRGNGGTGSSNGDSHQHHGNGNGNGNGNHHVESPTNHNHNNYVDASSNFENGTNDGVGIQKPQHPQQQQQQHPQQPPRKPVSPLEAELTAKNYRLARELSDLRVKHREEIKNVTRLTMDNMNLASRCRRAVLHIEKLNKELEILREKSAEAVFSQLRNGFKPRSPLEVSVSSNNSPVNNGDIRKRHTKNNKGQPQDNDLSPMTLNSHEKDDGDESSELDLEDDSSEYSPVAAENEMSKRNKHNNEKENNHVAENPAGEESNSYKEKYFKSIRNKNHLTNNNRKENTNHYDKIGDDSDIAFGELHSDDFFTGTSSYENSLPATPEKENVDITAKVRDQFENFNMDDDGIKESNSNEENSIDAFEASFQTAFPSSFSQVPSDQNLSLDEIFNDSDSFFTSADMSVDRTPSPKESGGNDPTLFPDTFGDNIPEPNISTPPKDKEKNDHEKNLEPPLPPSEKQSGGAKARARYKYALADPDVSAAPMDEAAADKVETSPALVLQRLQQRKAKEKLNSIASSDNQNNNSSRTPRSTISEEIRKLDAIANGTFAPQTSSGSRRRNVKQPISYAEPTLKSKLRRGDVFFPKGEAIDREANTETTVTS